mmetsp:Transcript_22036/g.35840  ORF Transcript_22036/g.35840 Transcript_22036/m.35840 type:complete len:389 (-) Transcript_22036:47-1213(-)
MQKRRQNHQHRTDVSLPNEAQRHGHEYQPARTRRRGTAHFVHEHLPAHGRLREEQHDGNAGDVSARQVKAGGEDVPSIVLVAEVTTREFGVGALRGVEVDLLAGGQRFLGPLQPDDAQQHDGEGDGREREGEVAHQQFRENHPAMEEIALALDLDHGPGTIRHAVRHASRFRVRFAADRSLLRAATADGSPGPSLAMSAALPFRFPRVVVVMLPDPSFGVVLVAVRGVQLPLSFFPSPCVVASIASSWNPPSASTTDPGDRDGDIAAAAVDAVAAAFRLLPKHHCPFPFDTCRDGPHRCLGSRRYVCPWRKGVRSIRWETPPRRRRRASARPRRTTCATKTRDRRGDLLPPASAAIAGSVPPSSDPAAAAAAVRNAAPARSPDLRTCP